MDVARKWHFSTLGGAANLGGVSGDLSEHCGSGIPLLGITSLSMHKLTGLLGHFMTFFANLPTKLLPNNFFANMFVKVCNNML